MRIERAPRPGRVHLERPVARGDRQPHGQRVAGVPRQRENLHGRRPGSSTPVARHGRSLDDRRMTWSASAGPTSSTSAPAQLHPDYLAGPHESPSGANSVTTVFSEQFTFTPQNHTLKFGVRREQERRHQYRRRELHRVVRVLPGTPQFRSGAIPHLSEPFSDAALGELFRPMDDWRTNYFVSDKWQATHMLTLNLGIRYDYQHMIPQTKNALRAAARRGVRSRRRGRSSGGRWQVLRVSVDGHSRQPPCRRGDLAGLQSSIPVRTTRRRAAGCRRIRACCR